MCPKWFLRLWCIRRKLCTYLELKLTLSPNRPKRDSIWHSHLRVLSGASKLIYEHMVRSMQIVHLSCIKISSISKQTKPSFHLSLFIYEFQQVCPKWFLRLWCIRHKLSTYLAPKLILSPNGQNKIPSDTCHLGVPSGASKLIFKHMVCLASRLGLSPNRPNQAST